tara:strand:+ start:264 stop:413 length:150 start_codon:yes stop_codon:yes gene_type:complete
MEIAFACCLDFKPNDEIAARKSRLSEKERAKSDKFAKKLANLCEAWTTK